MYLDMKDRILSRASCSGPGAADQEFGRWVKVFVSEDEVGKTTLV
jgi:hypothetical protein